MRLILCICVVSSSMRGLHMYTWTWSLELDTSCFRPSLIAFNSFNRNAFLATGRAQLLRSTIWRLRCEGWGLVHTVLRMISYNSFKIYGTRTIQTIAINKSEVGWEKTCVPEILLKPNILGQPLGSRKRVTVLRDGLGIRPQIGRVNSPVPISPTRTRGSPIFHDTCFHITR